MLTLMSDLPHYFESMKSSRLSSYRPYSFEYDHLNEQFMVGNIEIPAAEFDPYEFSPYGLHIENQTLDVSSFTDNALLLDDICKVIATPKLHNFAKQNSIPMSIIVPKVMSEVYQSLSGESFGADEEPMGAMGFDLRFREHDSGLRLQVLGSCACFEPGLYGTFEGVEKGFAEYDLHNADSQAQRTALYAGLGSIAKLANKNS